MKRPEGFDRPAAAPTRTAEAPRQKKSTPETPPAAVRAPRPPRETKPLRTPLPTITVERTPKTKTERAPRVRRASSARTAQAEVRAAARARRRQDKLELRRFTRRARNRRIGLIVTGTVVATLIGLVLVAVYSPLLALRTITVDGTSRLDAATVQKAVDGQLGTPLALLDESRIASQLADFRLIRSYVTELVPPGTLVIHVVERVPIGVVQTSAGFDLVDPAGVTVDTTPERPAGVPLIQLTTGADVGGAGFESMAEVLLALPDPLAAQVDTISASTHDDVNFTLAGGIRVVWGSADDSTGKGALLAAVLTQQANAAGEYDVSATGNAVYRAS